MTKKNTAFAPDLQVPGVFDGGPVPVDDTTLLERLIARRDGLAPEVNKNDVAATLIMACIEGGVRDQNGIVGTVSRAGLKRGHVGAILTKERDGAEHRARWTRGADGLYQTLKG